VSEGRERTQGAVVSASTLRARFPPTATTFFATMTNATYDYLSVATCKLRFCFDLRDQDFLCRRFVSWRLDLSTESLVYADRHALPEGLTPGFVHVLIMHE
jgi:hypothetical protein